MITFPTKKIREVESVLQKTMIIFCDDIDLFRVCERILRLGKFWQSGRLGITI